MVGDSNAACIDIALDALLVFADTYGSAGEHAAEVAPGVIAKGLSGRPGTAMKAEEALLKLVEVRNAPEQWFCQVLRDAEGIYPSPVEICRTDDTISRHSATGAVP